MKKDILKKLSKYTAFASATAFAGNVNADIIYTDSIYTIPDNDIMNIDFGTGDKFQFEDAGNVVATVSSSYNFQFQKFKGLNSYYSVAANIAYNYASALNADDIINNSLNFKGNLPTNELANGLGYMYSYSNFYGPGLPYVYNVGSFNTGADSYVGVKFPDPNGFTVYGWIRVNVSTDWDVITVKGWAYEDNPFVGQISAGNEGIYADMATSLVASDVSDNLNGSDLQITFNKATDESTVGEYIAFVVDSAEASTFDLATARNIKKSFPSRYKTINKTGSNLTANFIGIQTTAGFTVQQNSKYRVFVMSTSVGTATNASLSMMSNEVVLSSAVSPAELVTNLIASDANDNYNGTDLRVAFNAISNEANISEYRVHVVKSANSFDSTAAEANTNAIAIAPTGSNISQTLSASAKDSDGDVITFGVPYKFYVMSVAANGQPFSNNLSAASNEITLSSPIAGTATGLIASDATNNYNASDFRVIFDAATNENYVSEYKVFVKKASVSFDITAAEANTNGISFTPTGNKIIEVLSATAKDTDGDVITMDTPYRFYVLSVGANGAENSLSTVSNEVTLSKPLGINAKDLDKNVSVFNNNGELMIKSTYTINSVEIISLDGKTITSKSGNNINSINISNLENGLHIARITTDEGVVSKKFIK